jgi:hypothetical protein
MAHRRAKWEESDSARDDLGVFTRELHLSALLPTTRRTHAARHGTLHTTTDQEEWYQKDGNAINCRCSTVEVLTDKSGNPENPAFVAKVKKEGKSFFPSR